MEHVVEDLTSEEEEYWGYEGCENAANKCQKIGPFPAHFLADDGRELVEIAGD